MILASEILSEREEFIASLRKGREDEALLEILSVGMSAGGARAKALIAWNPETMEIRSGQVPASAGFDIGYLSSTGSPATRTRRAALRTQKAMAQPSSPTSRWQLRPVSPCLSVVSSRRTDDGTS